MSIIPVAKDPCKILVRHIVDGSMNASPEGIARSKVITP